MEGRRKCKYEVSEELLLHACMHSHTLARRLNGDRDQALREVLDVEMGIFRVRRPAGAKYLR